jgi:hypothetical protein
VDFQAGRFALCRVSGRPGEMLIGRDIHVDVPRAWAAADTSGRRAP